MRHLQLLGRIALLGAALAGAAIGGAQPGAVAAAPAMRFASVTVQGLELSLSIPAGNYFLGELIPTTVSLSNASRAPVMYSGDPVPSVCGSAIDVSPTAGSQPYDRVPVRDGVPCPPPAGLSTLNPGQTITIADFLPLGLSGQVVLTAFATLATRAPGGGITIGPGPFAGKLPHLTIAVAPVPPPDRRIGLLMGGPTLYVLAPPGALGHLVYEDSLSCGNGGGDHRLWTPLPAPTLAAPACDARLGSQWLVLVGAPGYSVAYGTF